MEKVKVEIFDPPMCCSTGVCGPSVDPVLVKLNETVMKLKKQHGEKVDVERHMLSKAIQPFQQYQEVMDLINAQGTKALPITTVNGKILKSSCYPTYEQILAAIE